MTITVDEFIARVLEPMPHDTPRRNQIAMELRSHIADRLEHGVPLAEVLDYLGDPDQLAENYLAALPLESAPAGSRIAAKLVDALVLLVPTVPVVWLCLPFIPGPQRFFIGCAIALGVDCLLIGLYSAIAEALSDQTVGKRLMGLRVVQESGARITAGQAVVRQLPIVFSVIWIDALFALFTARSQRAFELLSRTRTVRVLPVEAAAPVTA